MSWCLALLVVCGSISLLSPKVDGKCSGGQHGCPDTYTCCEPSNGTYGCCPMKDAICCSDDVHCCPHGYTCDVAEGICRKDVKTLSLLKKIPATATTNDVGLSNNVICAGGATQCPPDHSCCYLPDSEQVHCCPRGYTCGNGQCSSEKGKIAAIQLEQPRSLDSIVKCDHKTACLDRYTCCKADVGFVCCPKPQATCCSDQKHCCPRGFVCSTDSKTCLAGSTSLPAIQLRSTVMHKPWKQRLRYLVQLVHDSIISKSSIQGYPDGSSKCPPYSRSCRLSSGAYGCCPFSKQGVSKSVRSIICPDGQSQCPDGNTCCKLTSGQYGCCPFPNAVCCCDHKHCCPDGYTCDVSAGLCNKGNIQIAMFNKVLAMKTAVKTVNTVVCPGGQYQCPDGNTCCKLDSGQYGCCPFPNAVCCSDHKHCCPDGYTCDVSAGSCSKGNIQIAMFNTVLAMKTAVKTVNTVVCPGGQSHCPDGYTCCQLASGQYGCCPFPNAVCCSDRQHCCPQGYICHVCNNTCTKGKKKIPLFEKMLSTKVVDTKFVLNDICPDGRSQCPYGNTCCKLSSGQYGCCPLPKAVCCSDEEHCCPQGFKCNISNAACISNEQVSLSALSSAKRLKSVYCNDGFTECPNNYTCCKSPSGVYDCCALPDAVCCDDGEHCCPQGYMCDVEQGKCNKEEKPIQMIANIPSDRNQGADWMYVYCPDGSQCLDYETCCKLSDGSYGCCPVLRAVCCSDLKHCCPCGWRCDVETETCQSGSVSFQWLEKKNAFGRPRPQQMNLDEKLHFVPGNPQPVRALPTNQQRECPLYQTGCPQPSGGLHCCPLPDASCCADGEHCCPQGFSCDPKSGKCASVKKTVFSP